MRLYWVRLYGGYFTYIIAWISCNNLSRLVSHHPAIFLKLVGKNEIQRCEVTLLSHRASNCTGKHPSLPVLGHSTILLSSYMFLDLPLWGCSVEIRTSPEKEPTEWSREMHMHHSCQVHSHLTQSPPHLRPSKQLYLSSWNKQITGEELQ